MVPVLETERLRLRPMTEADLDPWVEVTSDPEVYRHTSGAPLSREDTWRRLMGTMGSWMMLGYGYWAADRKQDGRMIGHVGFGDFKRDIEPSIDGVPEAGWVFAREAHGQGYAGEAVAAAIAWAEANLSAERYCCIIAPENRPSIRLAEKLGFIEAATTTYRGDPTLLFYRAARPAGRRIS